jgi:hypothetical protein
MQQSKWRTMIKNEPWDLVISDGPEKEESFSILEKNKSYFLEFRNIDFPVIFISKDKMTLMGLPAGGPYDLSEKTIKLAQFHIK